MNRGVLYLSYSGMLEPLGQSQVLAYQERLAADHPVHIISFERARDWADIAQRDAVAKRMADAGIHWHPLRYHKRLSLLATFWDIACGAFTGWRLVQKHGLAIVHARSYVPSVMAVVIKRLSGVRYVFDMRGFWVDERVDGGIWPRGGHIYRTAKWFERRFLLAADHVVSLTEAGIRELAKFDYMRGAMPPCTVIPTCADLSRFKPRGRKSSALVLGYVGSVGTWYLFDEVVMAFCQLLKLRPDARLLVINRNDHVYVRERLQVGGVPLEVVEIIAATHAEVPEYLCRMHAGIFFIKPVFSKQASAPTKLGEFLGCGIPCLANSGVGDMAELMEADQVGIAIADFQPSSIREGMSRLLALVADPDVGARCVASAQAHFSLDEGVRRYQAVYRSLEARP
ncbi:glycosyltransferase [Flagellatimonas centrodinii]|uniref:glycosyltransferase n=1 Tax=Flagellatimonas centrodinii TaxID=2806210 RepID=UPI001FEE9DA3|nr:glycosyltransferase [Flagellatimonas centrodinii]ULQ46700.1 glycosyltransferase [Flagellatimonas centrodinii]